MINYLINDVIKSDTLLKECLGIFYQSRANSCQR